MSRSRGGEESWTNGVRHRRRRGNRRYFADKLRALKQKTEVVRQVEEGQGEFLLLDSRSRDAFCAGHIRGAWCAPAEELGELVESLPQDRELVVYCWNHY